MNLAYETIYWNRKDHHIMKAAICNALICILWFAGRRYKCQILVWCLIWHVHRKICFERFVWYLIPFWRAKLFKSLYYSYLIVNIKRSLPRHENTRNSKLHNDLAYLDKEVKVNQHCKLFCRCFSCTL